MIYSQSKALASWRAAKSPLPTERASAFATPAFCYAHVARASLNPET